MSNFMLIDGNSIGFACQQANKLSYNGEPVQALFGFIKTLKRLKERFVGYTPIVLWDGHSWRYDIYPDYKGNRKDPKTELMKIEYKKQYPAINKMLQLLGVMQVTVGNYEADDLAYIYAEKMLKHGKVVLVSGDKDWLQIVQPNVVWYDPIRDRSCATLDFDSFTGCENPRAFVDKKCLIGDSSDNIKGVGGIGEVKALALLKEYGCVDNFLQQKFTEDELKCLCKPVRALYTNESGSADRLHQNRKLMKLGTKETPKPEGMNIINGNQNLDEFEEFCMNYGFSSIAMEIDDYKRLFGDKK